MIGVLQSEGLLSERKNRSPRATFLINEDTRLDVEGLANPLELLLLDEPLSNLDAELRHATRQQLTALQRRVGITAIYVTHDQEEALEMADRIAVIKDGHVEQVGTPQEILEQPATDFVRTFLDRQRG